MEQLQQRRRTNESGHRMNTIAAIADWAGCKLCCVVKPAIRAGKPVP